MKKANVINTFVLFFGNRQLNFKQLLGTGKETLPKKGVQFCSHPPRILLKFLWQKVQAMLIITAQSTVANCIFPPQSPLGETYS